MGKGVQVGYPRTFSSSVIKRLLKVIIEWTINCRKNLNIIKFTHKWKTKVLQKVHIVPYNNLQKYRTDSISTSGLSQHIRENLAVNLGSRSHIHWSIYLPMCLVNICWLPTLGLTLLYQLGLHSCKRQRHPLLSLNLPSIPIILPLRRVRMVQLPVQMPD